MVRATPRGDGGVTLPRPRRTALLRVPHGVPTRVALPRGPASGGCEEREQSVLLGCGAQLGASGGGERDRHRCQSSLSRFRTRRCLSRSVCPCPALHVIKCHTTRGVCDEFAVDFRGRASSGSSVFQNQICSRVSPTQTLRLVLVPSARWRRWETGILDPPRTPLHWPRRSAVHEGPQQSGSRWPFWGDGGSAMVLCWLKHAGL